MTAAPTPPKEVNERADEFDDVEIFRLSAQGGLEFHKSDGLPFVRVSHDGVHNSSAGGVTFDASGLRRLASYIDRYAARLERKYAGYTPGVRRKMVAEDLA